MKKLIIATCNVCGLKEKQVDTTEEKVNYICSSCKRKKTLKDSIKTSLYNAVSKYQYEIIELNDEARADIKRIVSIAKQHGFTTECRNKNGLNELILFYNGKWLVDFYVRAGENTVTAQLDEYELLTGKALDDFKSYQAAEAHAEMEADRKMSLYNSGYRNF